MMFPEETFVIDNDESTDIAYFPLHKKVFLVTKEGGRRIKGLMHKDLGQFQSDPFISRFRSSGILDIDKKLLEEPNETDHTKGTLELGSTCNLRCVYCGLFGGDSKRVMPLRIGKVAIDMLLDNADKKGKNAEIFYHGGGEPFTHFNERNRKLQTRLWKLYRKRFQELGLDFDKTSINEFIQKLSKRKNSTS